MNPAATRQFQWGHEFANPWHDEEGKFAPKGTGTKSDGTGSAPAPEETAAPGTATGGRTSGADTVALAQTVIEGGEITIDPVDADDVIKQFADAPGNMVDLTAVTLKGRDNMFSAMRELGVPRDQMPQITPDVAQQWWSTLTERGINYRRQQVDPADLSATQSELNGKKVGGMINAMQSGEMSLEGDPLMVSNDGHVLDGHHRWAATAAMSADCGGCIKIPVVVIDLPIADLLPLANQWVDERGIPRAGVGQASKIVKKTAGMSPVSFTIRGVRQFAKLTVDGTDRPEDIPMHATDTADGITPEDTADLPHGNSGILNQASTPPPATGEQQMAYRWGSPSQFANPWHDEIGRFAPKGTGRKFGGGRQVPVIEHDANGDIIVSDEAKALAKPIHEEAVRHEAEMTRTLSALIGDEDPANYAPDAPPPPQLYGYTFRFKGEAGIAEKIERIVEEKGLTREEAARDIKDALRYTVHYTQDEFGPSAQRVIDQLAEQYPAGKVKNTWPPSKDNPYKGVNVNVTTEDGFTLEIQFHTPESQAIKDQQHEIYKDVRHLPANDPRKIQADARMMEMAATLQEAPPTGAIEVSTPAKWRKQKNDGSFRTSRPRSTPQWRLE